MAEAIATFIDSNIEAILSLIDSTAPSKLNRHGNCGDARPTVPVVAVAWQCPEIGVVAPSPGLCNGASWVVPIAIQRDTVIPGFKRRKTERRATHSVQHRSRTRDRPKRLCKTLLISPRQLDDFGMLGGGLLCNLHGGRHEIGHGPSGFACFHPSDRFQEVAVALIHLFIHALPDTSGCQNARDLNP